MTAASWCIVVTFRQSRFSTVFFSSFRLLPPTYPHRKKMYGEKRWREKNVSTISRSSRTQDDDDSLTWKNERRKDERECEGGRKEKEPKSLHLFLSATIQHQSIFRCKTRWAPTGLIRLCSQRSPKVYYNNTTRRRNSSTGGHSIRPFSSQSLSTALNVFLARCSPKGASACSLDDPPAEI